MISMHNANFVIVKPYRQVWAITSVNAQDIRWLRAFSNHIPNSKIIVDDPIIPTEDIIYMGLFSYNTFRQSMKDLGYRDAVNIADESFCLT